MVKNCPPVDSRVAKWIDTLTPAICPAVAWLGSPFKSIGPAHVQPARRVDHGES